MLSLNGNHLLLNWVPWQPQQHNDVNSGLHLGFSNFQFFSDSKLNTENSETTPFSDWNLQIVRSIVKYQYLGENSRSFSEKLHSRSSHSHTQVA